MNKLLGKKLQKQNVIQPGLNLTVMELKHLKFLRACVENNLTLEETHEILLSGLDNSNPEAKINIENMLKWTTGANDKDFLCLMANNV